MRTANTLSSLCFLASLVVLAGCKHATSSTKYHNTVSEPVGVLEVSERVETPGVFVTIDENEMKPAVTTRAESKPMRTSKPLPTQLSPGTEQLNIPTVLPTKLEKEKSKPISPAITPASGILEPLSQLKTTTSKPIVPESSLGIAPIIHMAPAAELPSTDLLDSFNVSLTVVPKSSQAEVVVENKATQSIIPVGLKKLAELKLADTSSITKTEMVVLHSENSVSSMPESKRAASKIKSAHAADYRWLIGELTYSKAKKVWRVRYAGVDFEDDFGGSVTLFGNDEWLDKVVEGQKVRVEGKIVDHNDSPSPRYLMTKLTLLD